MALSVALCTYRGEAFVGAQLDSLAAQSRLPDELVVCDDASTDATVGIVRAFAQGAPFPVRVQVNPATLGFAQNFALAISRCQGDLIALCDQDDVWLPGKLAQAEALLAEDPDVGLVCSDAEVVDAALRPVGQRLWESIRLTEAERGLVASDRAVAVLLERNIAMGASTVFRSSFLPWILPIPTGWHHDWWIALVVSLRARLALIDTPQLLYRQHGANQLGIPEPVAFGVEDLLRSSVHPRTAEFIAQEAQWRGALERIEALQREAPTRASEADLMDLRRKVGHLRMRAALPAQRRRRVRGVMGELARGNYRRYSAGVGSAVKDLFVQQVPEPLSAPATSPGPAGPADRGPGSG